MVPFKRLFSSTLGRKYLMAASGFALVLFIVVHLLGNLTLFTGTGDAMNLYASKLDALGVGKLILEIGLGLTILLHVVTAIQVTYSSKVARPVAYDSPQSKGGPTKNTITTRNMIITGLVLLVFIIVHLIQFRFGPKIEDGYTANINGVMVHDIHRLVVETFLNLKNVIFYMGTMLFLGFHFRHGFWSAFQSLGMLNPRWSKPIHGLGFVIAILLTIGFLLMPIYIYVTQGGAS
jgi:succinate dehydrogenase / fumarate reductase, cytochrome b subunit